MRTTLFSFTLVFFILHLLQSPLHAADTIKIGVTGAHQGDLASYGLPSLKATQLVVKDVNAQGGINGVPIELLVEDDGCKPEVATNVATKLVAAGVRAVIGPVCSGPTKATLPIYRDANVVVISPAATTPNLSQDGAYPNFFRTIAADDTQARLQTDFTLQTLKAKKIAILHDKGDYGKGLAEYAKTFIEQSDNAKVVLFEGVTPGAVDYSAVIQKIKRSNADAVLFGGYHPEASKIVGQMRQKRLTIPFISDDGVKDATFIKVAGKDAEGVYATGPADVSNNPIAIMYREKFKAAEGTEPGSFFNNAVAAALALTQAMTKAGSADADAVKEALRAHAVATPFGDITFDDRGEPVGIGFFIYQVQNGQFVLVQ
ncbi:branched-chain amino acid ABC transporter substrate-binding protein [Desulfobulbus oligotrophicus]|jgi:branched-chain amino acid transport system substrate-binding protein|uniref:Branched-chain amino acid ABC transporter substrate-binding protein n=1 Tax=Desulfobulbus oligotrophicus TaxID=1909699 RepID=A0A7T5VEK5_9BACT|nr:branched-chain amino acid ABC transporter substrate-binding protein [Desulfobulbus oligotrophicus]MDY0390613.1 branched-chain amino acid ABC transporter substrate-binding protein [Desulfobulbus oligotrophicus]QQG66454.1 branched-chain amino acid ABC transporter substrate-binding protein [Desulfobulbus oligotrophicus]